MRRIATSLFPLCLLFLLGAPGALGGETPGPTIAGIVFVAAPAFDDRADADPVLGSYHWRDGYVYARGATYHQPERTTGPNRLGKNLYALVPARPGGKLTRLTHLTGSGAVFKPAPSFDGTKVLFAMRRDGEDWFHLYEVGVDGGGLRQLTDGPFNDFAGVYLPDGRIVFCSDRGGFLDEYHEERTESLFVMHGDGTGIEQITFLPGTYFEPTVLRDGRILFSFWDAFHIDVPPFDKHETYLATVHPDGTSERHFFGAGQYRFFERERHSGVGLTQPREMPDGRILVQSELGPSLIDLRAGPSVREALAPIFPGTTSVQVGGTTHRVHLSPLGTRSTAYPLPDGRILYSATPPGARDRALYAADPDTRRETLVYQIPGYAAFDAVPVLVAREKPAALPQRKATSAAEGGTARFLVVAAHATDHPERDAAMRRARFLRVIEGEYTGVTTSSHTNHETRILGVVPLWPDGSAYFEAPADTPLFLDPLDAAGNRILMDWPYENTSVAHGLPYPATQLGYMSARPGEVRSCYGCHAPQQDAVPNVSVQAVKLGPVRVERTATSLQYRRNDPEAYRRQALIGEGATYRKLLASPDPALRARGCEMLAYLEDEADPAEVAALLKDADVAVRRAAALALAHLATAGQAAALETAAKDADVQVRFAATAALDVLHAAATSKDAALVFESLGRGPATAEARARVRAELQRPVPEVAALRAAGKLRDADAVPLLVPWLAKHEYEYHAAEAAVALGRIGTPEAIAALWQALRREVPRKQVHIARYLQHGPRPEEYALVRGLLLARAKWSLDDLHLLIALLPNTFMEKPRFEDRMRGETQRVVLPRVMLERAGLRRRAVELLLAALHGAPPPDDPLYRQLLKGVNLERPFTEHGRPFPVVQAIGPEEALWLLTCLVEPATDLADPAARQALEARLAGLLTSKSPRARVDAAVLLGRIGFGKAAADTLLAEATKPYPFSELVSIGKGMPDPNERDKAYMALALARHIDNVDRLRPLADPKAAYRDIRYGLARGLAWRGKADAIPLLLAMAAGDPITLIRRQARDALADIQDAARLAGRPVPPVTLPSPRPLEALYPPRGLTWTKTDLSDLPAPPADRLDLSQLLVPKHFRNLTIPNAAGARYMMVERVEETRRAFDALAQEPGRAATKQLIAALDTPYPYAHYLAAKALARGGDASVSPALVARLDAAVKAQDTVGFWWLAEALGDLKAKDALPALARYAIAKNPPGVYGPAGMGIGYPAARAVARLAADAHHPEVARLLKSENVWLRAAALRGLAEAHAPGIETLLRQAAGEDEPAVVRQEARVQLTQPGERGR